MAAPVYQNWMAKQRQHTSSVGREEAQRLRFLQPRLV